MDPALLALLVTCICYLQQCDDVDNEDEEDEIVEVILSRLSIKRKKKSRHRGSTPGRAWKTPKYGLWVAQQTGVTWSNYFLDPFLVSYKRFKELFRIPRVLWHKLIADLGPHLNPVGVPRRNDAL